MTRHLIVALLLAAGCSRPATPEQACKNIETRCGTLAAIGARQVVDCTNDLPKLGLGLGDADYAKLLRCASDAESCSDALACFGGAGKALGGKLTRDVLDPFKK